MSLGVWFLDEVVDMPVIVHIVFFALTTVEAPQLQFLDKVVDVFFVQFIKVADVPVIMQRRGLLSVLGQRQVLWVDRAENCGGSAVAVLFQGERCRCRAGRRFGLLLWVPQIQFIARVRGSSSVHRDRGHSARVRWRCRGGHFSRSSGLSRS